MRQAGAPVSTSRTARSIDPAGPVQGCGVRLRLGARGEVGVDSHTGGRVACAAPRSRRLAGKFLKPHPNPGARRSGDRRPPAVP